MGATDGKPLRARKIAGPIAFERERTVQVLLIVGNENSQQCVALRGNALPVLAEQDVFAAGRYEEIVAEVAKV